MVESGWENGPLTNPSTDPLTPFIKIYNSNLDVVREKTLAPESLNRVGLPTYPVKSVEQMSDVEGRKGSCGHTRKNSLSKDLKSV
jgi:hypothetical protein